MNSNNYFSKKAMNGFSIIMAAFCLMLATQANAQQKPSPCAEDGAKLCKGVQQGGGRIAQCLKEHANELSPACKSQAAEAKEKIHDFANACKADMQKLCAGTKPSEGRLVQCLKQHEAELSADCKTKMTQGEK